MNNANVTGISGGELSDAQLDGVVGGGILGDAWNWVKGKGKEAAKKVGDAVVAAVTAWVIKEGTKVIKR